VDEPWIVLLSLALEALVGYPAALHARIPHPVVWAGKAITAFERTFNRAGSSNTARKLWGCVTVICVAGIAANLGFALEAVLDRVPFGWLLIALIGTVGLAQRSLYEHVRNVLRALRAHNLPAAREQVARIVGRDTSKLHESGVSAAALESLAESFNDGVLAPAFWFVVGGLPGLFAYKALNTADSLIGHQEERWRAFGWAAARADDVANLIPARIAGALLAVAGGRGFSVMVRDAPKHASPNAGWPEAAMAGALGIQLGGPAVYDGIPHMRPTFGQGEKPHAEDLARGMRIYLRACVLMALLIAATGAVWPQS
jgi:adenosylcobinamide-phosphate synthase